MPPTFPLSLVVSPEAKNATLWTRGADVPRDTVVAGELVFSHGGPQPEQPGRVRIVAVPGPQASLTGVAWQLAGYVNSIAGTYDWLDPVTIARAILQYNRPLLGVATRPDLRQVMNGWQVGTLLTLPVELALTAAGAVEHVVVDLARLRWLAEQEDDLSQGALVDDPVHALGRPDPAAIAQAAKVRLAAAGYDPAAHGAELRAALLVNPFAVVFEAVETFRQLREHDTAAPPPAVAWRAPFTLALLDGVGRETAGLLASTTSGNAVLRAAWHVLAGLDPAGLPEPDRARRTAAQNALASALGLVAKAGGGWFGPAERRPSVAPAEPPLTPVQRVIETTQDPTGSGDANPRGSHEMVHGRSVTVGKVGEYAGWRGPAYGGEVDPVTFATGQGDAVFGQAPTPVLRQALRIVLAIGPNEGRLDACRAQDSAFLSTGFQQWSAHTDTEMSVLLLRLQRRAPEHYDLLFGMYGLGVRRWTWSGAAPADDAASAADNPFDVPAGNPAASPFGTNFPTFVRFTRVVPDGEPVAMPPSGAAPGAERLAFFGGREVRKANGQLIRREFSGEWTARVRMAGLASTDYQAEQIRTGVFRLQRMVRDFKAPAAEWPAAFRAPYPALKDLLTSEWSAAIAIDFHIQRPGAVWTAVRAALVRTLATNPNPYVGAGPALDRTFLAQFHQNLLPERVAVTPAGDARKTMAGRNPLLVNVHDKGADATVGSFTGWPA